MKKQLSEWKALDKKIGDMQNVSALECDQTRGEIDFDLWKKAREAAMEMGMGAAEFQKKLNADLTQLEVSIDWKLTPCVCALSCARPAFSDCSARRKNKIAVSIAAGLILDLYKTENIID